MLAAACAGGEPLGSASPSDGKADDALPALLHGVLTTDVHLDLETGEGRAVVSHAPAEVIELEIAGLAVTRVISEDLDDTYKRIKSHF